MYLLSLVYYPCLYTFYTAIPTSTINVLIVFLCLLVSFFATLGYEYMHCPWATPTLQSILFIMFQFQEIIFSISEI